MNAQILGTASDGITSKISGDGSVTIRLGLGSRLLIQAMTANVTIDASWPIADTEVKILDAGEKAQVGFACKGFGNFTIDMEMAKAWSVIGYVQAAKGPGSAGASGTSPRSRGRTSRLAIAAFLLLGGIFSFEAYWSLSGSAHEQAARSWIRAFRPEAEAMLFGGPTPQVLQRNETPAEDAPPAPSAPFPGSAWSRPLPGRG